MWCSNGLYDFTCQLLAIAKSWWLKPFIFSIWGSNRIILSRFATKRLYVTKRCINNLIFHVYVIAVYIYFTPLKHTAKHQYRRHEILACLSVSLNDPSTRTTGTPNGRYAIEIISILLVLYQRNPQLLDRVPSQTTSNEERVYSADNQNR